MPDLTPPEPAATPGPPATGSRPLVFVLLALAAAVVLAYVLRYDYTGADTRVNRWTGAAEARVDGRWMDPASPAYHAAQRREEIRALIRDLGRD